MVEGVKLYPKVDISEDEKIPQVNESGEIKGFLMKAESVKFVSFLVEEGFIPDPRENLQKIREMQAHYDDILICAYIKAGTHWLWEIVSMLLKGSTEYEPMTKESHMLEFHRPEEFDSFVRPRVLNTHLPFDNLPKAMLQKRCKILFIQRNIKDILVSGFHHIKGFTPPGFPPLSWHDHLHLSMTEQEMYLPWYTYIAGFEEVLDDRSDHILPLFYEDLKKDPVAMVLSVSKFLKKDCSEEFAREVADKCNFQKLKEADKKKENSFKMDLNFLYRKGEVGDWKNHFTVAQNEKLDSLIKEKMANSRFQYQYTL